MNEEGGTEEKVKEMEEEGESFAATYHDGQCVHCSPLPVKVGHVHKDHTSH